MYQLFTTYQSYQRNLDTSINCDVPSNAFSFVDIVGGQFADAKKCNERAILPQVFI
jgi:hypothetical protein